MSVQKAHRVRITDKLPVNSERQRERGTESHRGKEKMQSRSKQTELSDTNSLM